MRRLLRTIGIRLVQVVSALVLAALLIVVSDAWVSWLGAGTAHIISAISVGLLSMYLVYLIVTLLVALRGGSGDAPGGEADES